MNREEAIVAVFGDLGRSPRMINHTRELVKSKFRVNIIGYCGGTICQYSLFRLLYFSDIENEIDNSPNISFHFIDPYNFNYIKKKFPSIEKHIKLLVVALRIVFLSANLIFIFCKLFLFGKKSPKIMIIQVWIKITLNSC